MEKTTQDGKDAQPNDSRENTTQTKKMPKEDSMGTTLNHSCQLASKDHSDLQNIPKYP
jgi:hypothetical protein